MINLRQIHQNAFGKHSSRIILFAFLSVHFQNQLSFAKMLPNVSYSRLTMAEMEKTVVKGRCDLLKATKKTPENFLVSLKHASISVEITARITHISVRQIQS